MVTENGKRLGGNSDYWIYLTDLRAYNEGILLGVYLHFPFDENSLDEAYKAIHVGNEFIDKNGCSYEECFITDYEAPLEVGEYSSPLILAEKYNILEGLLGLFNTGHKSYC